jgi:hypothetical protein
MQGFRPLVRAFVFTWPLTVALLSGCSSSGESGPPPDAMPDDGMPACSMGPTMADIEQKLFVGTKCKLCHVRVSPDGPLPLYPTTLDLGSPGLAARVVDKMAEPGTKGKCQGQVLLPRSDPLGSLFVEKVEATLPRCGDRMPIAMIRLNADEVSCVKRWAVLAAKSIP